MESISQKNSEEMLNNQELNEDINDIGLPKSSLHSFVKEILTKNKVRGDKNIIPMLDKISRTYVTYISSLGAKICTECGKKTLNLEHIFESLKKMKFNNHIELLVKDVKDFKNGEIIDTSKYDNLEEEKKNDNKNLKQLINKKKKRGGRKKKYFENEDERAQMKLMQEKMFEEARNDMNKQQEENMMENFGNINNEENNDNQIELEEDKGKKFEYEKDKDKDKNKEKYSNLDKELFINNGGDDDINFD